MLRNPGLEQTGIEMVTLDQLAPADHLLRRIEHKRRKETVARSFADARQLDFGHRYARFGGLLRVRWRSLLAAAAQNMKKIALLPANRTEPRPA
jgi:hypothetical protein